MSNDLTDQQDKPNLFCEEIKKQLTLLEESENRVASSFIKIDNLVDSLSRDGFVATSKDKDAEVKND